MRPRHLRPARPSNSVPDRHRRRRRHHHHPLQPATASGSCRCPRGAVPEGAAAGVEDRRAPAHPRGLRRPPPPQAPPPPLAPPSGCCAAPPPAGFRFRVRTWGRARIRVGLGVRVLPALAPAPTAAPRWRFSAAVRECEPTAVRRLPHGALGAHERDAHLGGCQGVRFRVRGYA